MATEPVPCLLWDIANDLSKSVFVFGPKYFWLMKIMLSSTSGVSVEMEALLLGKQTPFYRGIPGWTRP